MSLIIIAPGRDVSLLIKSIIDINPKIQVQTWPDIDDFDSISGAILWKHPKGITQQFPNLRYIQSLGAGVDHIVADQSIDLSLPIARIKSEKLNIEMAKYIVGMIISYEKGFVDLFKVGKIKADPTTSFMSTKHVGILGLGAIGSFVGASLKQLGYEVSGYSQSQKSFSGIKSYSGSEQLGDFLANLDVLVCLLPLTNQTENFLDYGLFSQLKKGALLINAARGAHLVEADLIRALDEGFVAQACMDVLRQEPIPDDHIFKSRKDILITPHIASLTDQEEVAGQIAANYSKALSGEELIGQINRNKGY
ncbi:MAG: NAD(P)-dependent oxidoreductase [Bacteroidota bacterium]